MGLLTNKMEREELKAGDHIYTYRAVFAYSHHGNFLDSFIPPKFVSCFFSVSETVEKVVDFI